MSDMSSMSRERKKDQLRRQMISTERENARNFQEQQADENIENLRRARKKARRRRLLLFLILLAVAAAAGFGVYQYFVFHQYTSYTDVWETAVAEGADAQYMAFGDNVLKYSKDGASYIDDQGKTVWMQSYEMKSPIASVNGNYAVIADRQGNTM